MLTGQTYGSASVEFEAPKSIVSNTLQLQPRQHNGQVWKQGRRPALTETEENLTAVLLMRYAERGLPLNLNHLRKLITIIVSRTPYTRRMLLPLNNRKPGVKFLHIFSKLHKDKFKFGPPVQREALHFRTCNAQTLTTNLATVERNNLRDQYRSQADLELRRVRGYTSQRRKWKS